MAKNAQKAIQIDEDRHHQRHGWRLERIGWSAIGLLLLASLLGAFGGGPLGRARAGSAAGLSLAYDRIQRASAPTEYRFEAAPALAPDGRLRLRFDAALLEEVELESIVPEPELVQAGPGYTDFEFALAPGSAGPARLVFRFRPATFGRVRGHVTAAGAPPVTIDQVVLP